MALLIIIAMTIVSYRSIQKADFALASIMVIVTIIAIFAQCYFSNKLISEEKNEKRNFK